MDTPVNGNVVSDKIKTIFSNNDYNFVCFEAPIFNGTLEAYKKIGPNLKQDFSVSNILPLFTHASLANNHIMDYGIDGCMETIDFLKCHNIVSRGSGRPYPEMYQPVILEKEDLRVAVFCLGESQYGCCRSEFEEFGYAWVLNPIVYKLIEDYKSKCDYVIMYLHAGLEDEETPLIDWRLQYRTFIDYGADLIVAGHPHIIQGKEEYNGKMIYYSLGNFFFNGKYASDTSSWTNSLMLNCDIRKDGISISETFLNFATGTISFSDDFIRPHFLNLSGLLTPENSSIYRDTHNKMLLRCWESYYRSYYSYPIWREKANVSFWRSAFNKLMEGYAHRCFLPPVSENKLYHNISIDTHRFAVSRICSIISDTH